MSLDASEATASFNRAKDLFQGGQYTESMRLLMDLDRKYPNTRNILLAMASCLEKLECLGEAEQICDRLLAVSPDAKVTAMKARIVAARSASGLTVPEEPANFDDIPLRAGVPLPPATTGVLTSNRRRMLLIGGVVAATLLILVLPFLLRMAHPQTPAGQQTPAPVAQQAAPPAVPGTLPVLPQFAIWIITAIISFGVSFLVLYPGLRFLGRLRGGNLAANLADLTGTMLVVYLWGLIPIVGWILGIMHFTRHYELSFFEALGLLMVAGMIQLAIITYLVRPLLLGGGFMLLHAAQ
jgi:hypothetical protein